LLNRERESGKEQQIKLYLTRVIDYSLTYLIDRLKIKISENIHTSLSL
jgi:hypothetical protein